MIGNCDCCDRENVPVCNVNVDGEPLACFICQGDTDPDPYGEMTMTDYSGAFRKITKEEADKLGADGAKVDWSEGAGWIVYDQQALEEFQAACARIAAEHPTRSRP